MPKLSDLQLVLLSAGSQHDDGALLPLAPAITAAPAAVAKSITSLVKRGLARKDGDVAVITDAGRAAIGVEDAPAPVSEPQPASSTKKAQVVALLQRAEGASLEELVAATGWLPHTTRAALTGLRKQHSMTKDKLDGVTRYRIAG